jgi:hypothetical protein
MRLIIIIIINEYRSLPFLGVLNPTSRSVEIQPMTRLLDAALTLCWATAPAEPLGGLRQESSATLNG